MNETTPWAAMLSVSLRAGVIPAAFWRLSLKEWRALTSAPDPASPLARATFEMLANRFPDARHE